MHCTMDNGNWTNYDVIGKTYHGQIYKALYNVKWKLDNKEWKQCNGEFKLDNGQYKLDNRQYKIGQWAVVIDQSVVTPLN